MWYSFTKLSETEDTVVYAFGFESSERTGRFEYNKKTKETVILQDSENADYYSFSYTIHRLIESLGAPDKEMIAYG